MWIGSFTHARDLRGANVTSLGCTTLALLHRCGCRRISSLTAPLLLVTQASPHMSGLVLLFELSAGYALFDVVKSEEIGAGTEAAQESITDLARFSKIVKYKAFLPFTSAEVALENMNAVSEGTVCGSSSSTGCAHPCGCVC